MKSQGIEKLILLHISLNFSLVTLYIKSAYQRNSRGMVGIFTWTTFKQYLDNIMMECRWGHIDEVPWESELGNLGYT